MPGGAIVPGTTQTEPHEPGSCRAARQAYETRLKRCTREGQADSCSCSCDSEGGGKVSCDRSAVSFERNADPPQWWSLPAWPMQAEQKRNAGRCSKCSRCRLTYLNWDAGSEPQRCRISAGHCRTVGEEAAGYGCKEDRGSRQVVKGSCED